MEASCVCNRSIVPEVLDDKNYKMWSGCMKVYLLGQDLWDAIIEPEPEAEEIDRSSSDSSKTNNVKTWRKKNALALHAIIMSCGPNFVSQVVEVESAKEAWDLLATAAEPKNGVADNTNTAKESDTTKDDIDYVPFIKAAKDGDWGRIERFLDCHPRSVSAPVFPDEVPVLHYLIKNGLEKIAAMLVNWMKTEDLEILDGYGYTALGVGATKWYPGIMQLLQLIISKNPNLPNIGSPARIPVTVAAWNGFKDTTRYLYSVTDKNILNPESGIHGCTLLINCIESKIFDIASNLVLEFPNILLQQDNFQTYPIPEFAKTFCALTSESRRNRSSQLKHWWSNFGEYVMKYVQHPSGRDNKIPKVFDEEKLIIDQARDFLQLVCTHVSTYGIDTLIDVAYVAMVMAAIHGNIEFISEMIGANEELIWAHRNNEGMLTHAVKNRREKVFNLIYAVLEQKDSLLSFQDQENNNILHFAAMSAPSHILDRTSGPALQVQTELQWFKEMWSLANPRYRESYNNDNLTPHELFTKSHEKLIDAGEKAMKDTAASSTVVGALIVTMMFAATFTVPGGNSQDGYPLFVNDELFKIFIVCDALSLYSSATSVLIFLGILTSRYAEDDFLLFLPRKLMLGISTLFFSIATMMVTFCAALAIMLHGRVQFILPIVLLAFVPIILFLSSIFPLLSKMYKSTFGPSIFDKNTKLPSKKEYKNIMNKYSSSVAMELPTNMREDNESL